MATVIGMALSIDQIQRVLVIGAHPDDVDFGCAGTTALFTGAGVQVSYCIVTDGDAGGFDPSVPRSHIPEIRRMEQRNAGKAVGVEDIHFLGYRDGELEASMQLRRDISRVIRVVKPDVVICQSPDRNYDRIYASHPDHLAAGEAALCAVYPDSRNPFAHTILLSEHNLEPWTVTETWLVAHATPNHVIDITDTIDAKLAALHCHESQHPEPDTLETRIREWALQVGQDRGLAVGRLGEAFRVIATA